MCKHANSAGQSLEMTWREDFGIAGEGKSRNPLLLTQNNDRLWNLLLQSTNLGVYVPLKGMTTSKPSQVPNHPAHIHTCWNLLKFLKPLSSDYRKKKKKTNMTLSHFCSRKFLNHFLKGVSLESNVSWIIAFRKFWIQSCNNENSIFFQCSKGG